MFEPSAEFAARLDREDPGYRALFHVPEGVYLAGHSLGLQPKSARAFIEQELEDWERLAVEAHFRGRDPWVSYHALVREDLALLVGAKPEEVVAMNSLTVNLHLMMVSFYRPAENRVKVLVEAGAFPSDRYAVRSQARLHGLDWRDVVIEIPASENPVDAIRRHASQLALVLMPGVHYATGQAFDLAAISEAAHSAGAVAGFDLAHAAGNLPLHLHEWGADFAVWCSYKYLNSGPGAVAGCFVHERHSHFSGPRLEGWWGHEETTRFQMDRDFVASPGADAWQLSNPPVLALAPVRASLAIFQNQGMDQLHARSLRLTGYLEWLLDRAGHPAFEIITPRDPARRGAQLSIRLARSPRQICDRLNAEGIVCDWREPDIMRVAPVPLYNSFGDVFRFAEAFTRLLR